MAGQGSFNKLLLGTPALPYLALQLTVQVHVQVQNKYIPSTCPVQVLVKVQDKYSISFVKLLKAWPNTHFAK